MRQLLVPRNSTQSAFYTGFDSKILTPVKDRPVDMTPPIIGSSEQKSSKNSETVLRHQTSLYVYPTKDKEITSTWIYSHHL